MVRHDIVKKTILLRIYIWIVVLKRFLLIVYKLKRINFDVQRVLSLIKLNYKSIIS